MLMKMGTVLTDFEARAASALKALFERISAIKLLDLKHESKGGFGDVILARIDLYGHRHTLACVANPDCQPAQACAALRELGSADAIPFVIAPYLSREAQSFCKQNQIGFLDFEGNARLTVGDFFIVMRSVPRDVEARASVPIRKSPARASVDLIFPNTLPKVATKQPPLALSA
ncbi:MAG TPA: hypothetical protein VGG45_09030 [Terracidiphilus sp.]